MKSFEYAAPGSIRDVAGLLAETWGKTEILAGGTDLITCLKQDLTAPGRVVSLKNVAELRGIQESNGSLRIGAATPLADLATHALIKEHFPALLTAIEGIGSPQMIGMGTVGGDLCQRPRCWYFRNGFGLFGMKDGETLVRGGDNRYHAIFATEGPALFVSASSLGPVFVALGATMTVEGPPGKSRTVPAAEFFQIPKAETERETALRPNELLTRIDVPLAGLRNATYEVRHRRGLDWPYVTATVAFQKRGNAVSDARVVLGHVAPIPWIAKAAADALNGGSVNEELAGKVGQAATSGAKPLSQNAYKVQLVKTAVKRATLAAAQA